MATLGNSTTSSGNNGKRRLTFALYRVRCIGLRYDIRGVTQALGESVMARVLLISTYELGRQPFGLASPAAWLRADGFEVTQTDLRSEERRVGKERRSRW